MAIYVLQTKRNTKTAKMSESDIFDWMEIQGIKVFEYNNFFMNNLDKTLLKKEDVLVFYITIPNDTRFDERVKKITSKKIFRTLDGYNTDGIPMRKPIEKMKRIGVNNVLYCHKNNLIDSFLKDSDLKHFFMPHCADFSNKRTHFNKKFDISISGHMSHEVYPARTRVLNYFSKVKRSDMSVQYLPHPGYDLSTSSHNIIGEKYIDFLSNSWIGTTCRGGWRNGMVSKYIEIGKANSIPLCDIPDSMDSRLKELVIPINDNIDNFSLFENVANFLSNKKEAKEKIKEYQNICEEVYDQSIVIKDFIRNCNEI